MAERKDGISADEPFLSRWSQRKQRAASDPGVRPDSDAGQAEDAGAETADEELAANREAAEAIDIGSLDEESDYSPFFKAGVPADLKSAALQRLWRSNPVFANIDGLNDYDEDFTIPNTPMGAIKTAWKFGRGFLSDEDIAARDEAGPESIEPGEGGDEAIAQAAPNDPDPVRLDPVRAPAGKDAQPGPAVVAQSSEDQSSEDQSSDNQSTETQSTEVPSSDAAGEKPDLQPAPGVGLRDRLDMAAFAGRTDD